MRFEDLPPGSVIAHRGGALQVPEHTMEGYRVALAQGLPVIEQDVHVLADGALGVMHDATVDRTSTSSGNVADHTSSSWKQLDLDAGTYLGGGWPNGLRPPLFEEVLLELGGRVLLCPEAKSAGSMGPLLDALERRGIERASVLVQSFDLADCRAAVVRGWDAVWLGSLDPGAAAAEGVRWIGPVAAAVTPALCAAARAAGVRVACHTVNRRWRRDALRAAGVDAIFSDDPLYLHSDAVLRRRDLFARQVWVPGVQADGGTRGRFRPEDGCWGLAAGPGGAWVLLGYLAPPDPASYVLDLQLRLDGTADGTADGGTAGSASVVVTTTDRAVTGAASPGAHGYQARLDTTGGLHLDRITDGLAHRLGSAPGRAPAPGSWTTLRLAVTPGGLVLSRPGEPGAVAAQDAVHRPVPVLHLGREVAAVDYREVVFS